MQMFIQSCIIGLIKNIRVCSHLWAVILITHGHSIDHVGLQTHAIEKRSGNIHRSVHETNNQFAVYFIQLECSLYEIGFKYMKFLCLCDYESDPQIW